MKTISLLLLLFVLPLHLYSQNITNRLGVGGQFIIEDATTDFLTLSQATGQVNIKKNLRLENTYKLECGSYI